MHKGLEEGKNQNNRYKSKQYKREIKRKIEIAMTVGIKTVGRILGEERKKRKIDEQTPSEQ